MNRFFKAKRKNKREWTTTTVISVDYYLIRAKLFLFSNLTSILQRYTGLTTDMQDWPEKYMTDQRYTGLTSDRQDCEYFIDKLMDAGRWLEPKRSGLQCEPRLWFWTDGCGSHGQAGTQLDHSSRTDGMYGWNRATLGIDWWTLEPWSGWHSTGPQFQNR